MNGKGLGRCVVRSSVLGVLGIASLVCPKAVYPSPEAQQSPLEIQAAPSDGDVMLSVVDRHLPFDLLRAPLRFLASTTLESEYDDNVFLSETDRQGDLRTTLAASLLTKLASPTASLEGGYSIRRSFYATFADLDFVSHSLTLAGALRPSPRLSLHLDDQLVRSDDPADADPLALGAERRGVLRNALTPRLQYEASEHVRLALQDQYVLIRNDDPRRDDGDVNTLRWDLDTAYSRLGNAKAGYEYTLARFSVSDDFQGHRADVAIDHRLTPSLSVHGGGAYAIRDLRRGSDFAIVQLSAGAGYHLDRYLSANASAGLERLDVERGADTNQLLLHLGLDAKFRSSALGVSLDSGLRESFLEADNLGVFRSLQATLSYRALLAPRLSVAAAGSVARHTFLQETGAPGSRVDREDDVVNGSISLAYQVTRWLWLETGYSLLFRESNVAGFDLLDNRLRFSLSVRYAF